MYIIQEFCKERKIPKNIRDSFIAFCKGFVSDYYQIGNGTTVTGILINFTDEEVEKMWIEYVSELKKLIETDGLASHSTELDSPAPPS